MAFEINGLNHTQTQSQSSSDAKQVDVARGEASNAQAETGTPSTTDTVSLTDTATRLQSLENTLSNLPVSDPQRVESFRQAILNGSYEVNPQSVAEKLMNVEEQLSSLA